MAQDFQTFRRFPAGLLLVDIDGRNHGGNDPTPIPTVIAIFDDVDDNTKDKTAKTIPALSNKSPRERVHLYDEAKLRALQKSNRMEVAQLKNEKGMSFKNTTNSKIPFPKTKT